MVERFYWLITDAIAGCSRPGQTGPQGPGASFAPDQTDDGEVLERDLEWLRRQGIGSILSLTETPLPADALARHGLESLHLPVPDLHAPLPVQFQQALDFIDYQRSANRVVAVHCLMGQGRTGAILAAYLIRSGTPAEEAIGVLRTICPGAIGAPGQESALRAYARRRDWII